MSNKLADYQSEFINKIRNSCRDAKSICAQLETGGGKTVIFSTIAHNFLQTSKKDVIIFVDSDNLFKQTRKTLLNWYGIDSDTINSDSSHIKRNTLFGTPRVFVAMVETFDRRSKRDTFLSQVRDVGLVIVDECHMGNFVKIFDHFLFSLRIGFTATPIASDKKNPLNKYYDTIVCGPTTSDLIEFNRLNPGRGVVRDVTFTLKNNVNRKEIEQEEAELGFKGEDFNKELVGSKLSRPKQIQNTIDAYIKHTPGKKMLCFNSNVAHSELVTSEMKKCGINARHIDGNATQDYRDEIFGTQPGTGWLAKTPNAVLCNVGMTTKGFDDPSVEGTIVNTLTKSIVKFRQMCGRSARPYFYPEGKWKEFHIILDMCDNVLGGGHGQWSDDIDWEYIFKNPKAPRPGVAPCKECPECGGICPASARKCRCMIEDFFENNGDFIECGHEFEIKVAKEDTVEKEMILVSKNIDVEKIINFPQFASKKEFFTLFETIRSCAYYTRNEIKHDYLEREEFEKIWSMTYTKIVEWQTIKGRMSEAGRKKRDTEWYTKEGRLKLLQYLREYGFVIDLVEQNLSI